MSEGQAGKVMRRPVQAILLPTALAAAVAGVFYAASVTAASDPFVSPYATALAGAVVVILVLLGLIDGALAKSGLLASVISLLPRFYSWAAKTSVRALATSVAVLGMATAAIWLGPGGIKTVSIACDEAAAVDIAWRPGMQDCVGVYSTSIWLSPLQRSGNIAFTCFDARRNDWNGTTQAATSGICGLRPIDARYVTNGIRHLSVDVQTVAGLRTQEGIQRLRAALADGRLPDRRLKDRLLIATWNLRYFTERPRLAEALAFIAEIVSHFDIVALQEVQDRTTLARLIEYLGDDYRTEFGFVSPGPAGNREQLGFIYDSRKIGLGEVSTTLVIDPGDESLSPTGQPSRPPFLAEFVLNGRPFFVATTHLTFGGVDGVPAVESRLAELRSIAMALGRAVEAYFQDHPLIFAGDLNVRRVDGPEIAALTENGFNTDATLASLGTSATVDRPYAQIFTLRSDTASLEFGRVGVFPVFDYVFRDEDWQDYKIDYLRLFDPDSPPSQEDWQNMYRIWRTFQISDHFPKWAEFRLD